MIHSALLMIEYVAVLGSVTGSVYYLLCLRGARAFQRERERLRQFADAAAALPPVSILKPLKGVDPEIYESFRSHCLQNYGDFELIFGASDPEDPAVASVRRLQAEFPERRIEMVVCANSPGPNVKVTNLAQMARAARHDVLIVNDSDIRVERDYLRQVTAPLQSESVGLVTCLYRGKAAPTLGSRLEALGISCDFCAGVLAARQIEGGIRFGLGSTLAFRRADLQRIGGFEAIADYLADDYELGKRIADLGMDVVLAPNPVETFLPAYSIGNFLEHQLRWTRGVRDARPGGYFGLLFTFGVTWSVLALALAGGAVWAWALFAVVLMLRTGMAWVVGRTVLQDLQTTGLLWLLPLRDLIATGIWVASYFGNTVNWRGDRFRLRKGKLDRIP
jgi:ceramide glucosyltransferase